MIQFDEHKCTGCQACQMACMDQRDISPDKGETPLRYVILREEPFAYISVGCIHCGACMEACPVGAITRRNDGIVLIDEESCIGCGICTQVCPYGVITMKDGHSIKCDGCRERVKAGLLPACVHTCPTGALSL